MCLPAPRRICLGRRTLPVAALTECDPVLGPAPRVSRLRAADSRVGGVRSGARIIWLWVLCLTGVAADGMASHEEDDVVDEPVFDVVDHDGMDGGRVAGDVDAGCFFLIDHLVAGRDPVQDARLQAGTVAEQRLVEGAQAVCVVS